MSDRADTQPIDPVTSDAEAAGTSSENDDPGGRDAEVSATPGPAGAPDDDEEQLPDPFFWPEEQAGVPEEAAAAAPTTERDETSEQEEINEIMARAMRWRSVEANKIITEPADIQNYVETCWTQELPAAQAARAALEAVGYIIVRKSR
jgi:hypothetical protein